MYHIFGLCPRTDIDMGRCGFGIKLYPAWKEAVKQSGFTEANVALAIKNYHRAWLDGCGYNRMHDPDASFIDQENPNYKPGPNVRPLYDIHAIRISWGEWGPEHITVPGNACGLDIDHESFGSPIGGKILHPHNIDCLSQVVLLLTIFTTLADHVLSEIEYQELTKGRSRRRQEVGDISPTQDSGLSTQD